MEQHKPKYIDDTPEAASVDESRREYYESEIKKALDDIKCEAKSAAKDAEIAALKQERDELQEQLEKADALAEMMQDLIYNIPTKIADEAQKVLDIYMEARQG